MACRQSTTPNCFAIRNILRNILTVLVFTLPLTAQAGSPKSICGPFPKQAPEAEAVRIIKESDLTAQEVQKAVATLEAARDPKWGGGHRDHLIVGSLRIIQGYMLKYRAEFYKTPESVEKFCMWLAKEAYWPE